MRKIREVLRLHFEHHLGQRQIGRAINISQSTVHDYLSRAKECGLAWPLGEEWDEARLNTALYRPDENAKRPPKWPQPDFAKMRAQQEEHRDLTIELIWQEYRDENPGGYCYSRFCKMYRAWSKCQDAVMRQPHQPGKKLFIDWAGATIPIHEGDGSVRKAALFVSALGYSSYTYAEAAPDQQLGHWLNVQANALEFYGGCPAIIVPDNPKTAVSRACLYEPDLNPTYQEFAKHYQVAVIPARPRKPRDKAKVENAVQVVQRFIVMKLRHRKFFSIHEANEAIRELLAALNNRPFRQRREECRASLFLKVDKPALKPLPPERYDMSQWSKARVNIDYHVAFDRNFYSVPYGLTGKQVEIRSTPSIVEIFLGGSRVASHVRGQGENESITHFEHRPKSHQAHLEWTPSRIVNWAAKVGPNTARLVEAILADKPHPEMGYRACLGLIRLAGKYSPARMETAAERALVTGAIGYKRVRRILESGLDNEPVKAPEARPSPEHENLRGPEYFG